jgi:iron complex outermembrane recepter protein
MIFFGKTCLVLFALFLPLLAFSESEKLTPVVVYGDKLNEYVGQQAGHATQIESDFLREIPGARRSYEDLLSAVAGAYAGNPTTGTFSIRGLNQDDVLAYFGTGSNALISVLEDGAPGSTNSLRYLPPLTSDLAGVEILRGPQSVSYGPNALGGTMLLSTETPNFSNDGRLLLEAAEYNTYRMLLAQNLVLLPDELALRLSYQHLQSDGFVENTFLGDDEVGQLDRNRYQARLKWQPWKNDDLQFDLSLVYDESDSNPFANVPILPNQNFYDRKSSLNTRGEYPAERLCATLNVRYLLKNDLEVKSTTSVQRFDLEQTADLDSTSFLNWILNGATDESRFTQDLTLAKKDGVFQWLLGGYYETSDYELTFSGRGFSRTPNGIPFANSAQEEVELAALYGRFDWEMLEKIHLSGLRLHHEERSLSTSSRFASFPIVRSANDNSEDTLVPQLGIHWQPTKQETVGIKVSRGFRGGGVSYAPSLGITQPYDSESSWETELFARASPRDDLQLSSAIFFARTENQQVPVNAPRGLPGIDTLIANAGSSQRYGVELEARWQAMDTLHFLGSLAYTQTEFRELILNGVNRSGQSLPNAPEWTASIGANYQHGSGVFASLLFTYADSTYTYASSPQNTALEARQLLSARIGYKWENSSIYLFGSNLLDDEYALLRSDQQAAGLPRFGKAGDPRVIGIGCETTW